MVFFCSSFVERSSLFTDILLCLKAEQSEFSKTEQEKYLFSANLKPLQRKKKKHFPFLLFFNFFFVLRRFRTEKKKEPIVNFFNIITYDSQSSEISLCCFFQQNIFLNSKINEKQKQNEKKNKKTTKRAKKKKKLIKISRSFIIFL